jgi:hypothetical protein
MKNLSTFISAGWDFAGESENGDEDIWTIREGRDYPGFVWQIEKEDYDRVDYLDFAVLALAWLSHNGDSNWNPVCDISEPNDNVIDELDLTKMAETWLMKQQ